MATSTLNISLPETQRIFVEEKVKKEGYGTISEYVRELIREAQRKEELKEQQREYLRQEIQKGIDDIREGRYVTFSSEDDVDKFVEKIKSNARRKLVEKQKKSK